MAKEVLFDDEAFNKTIEGIRHISKAVGATLGPRAHNVLFKRPFGAPGVVHDGVTVAKELDPEDPFVATVVEHVKTSATATNDEAGDGTTTAVVLTESLFMDGRRKVTAGFNAQLLARGVEKAVADVVRLLKAAATPVDDPKQRLQVAVVSSQREDIGEEVARAFEKLGQDAVIAVEESKQNHIYSEYKDGMEINQGYISRYFLTNVEFDEASVGESAGDPAKILVTDMVLSTPQDMQALFESLQELEVGNNFVVIAPEIKDIALATLIQNKMAGLHTLAVRAPGFGDEQGQQLEDIALSVGSKVLTKDSGKKLSDLPTGQDENGKPISEFLGLADKVVAGRDSTTIINGRAKEEAIKDRVMELKTRSEKETTSEFEVERLQERIAKLTSGVAVVNVGARTEGEAKDLKERTIDAVEAIKAANKGGIVPGGETALLRAAWELSKALPSDQSEEVLAGYKLVIQALQAPFRLLMENSGLDGGEQLAMLRMSEIANAGVDAIDGQIKDMVEAGIIDPVLVPISALQNAASAAMELLTSGVIVVDKKDDNADKV